MRARRVLGLALAACVVASAGQLVAPAAEPSHVVRPVRLQAPALPKLAAAPGASACILVSRPIVVELNDARTPEAVQHVRDAVRAGEPRLLHIDRVDADAHRAASLRGIPKVAGKDLDEYPPAVAAEGGAGADVRPIASSDNRSSGATMGAQLAPFCEGQRFIIEEGLP